MSIKKVYRAHVQHLGDGQWIVDYQEWEIYKQTNSRYYYKGSGRKWSKERQRYETAYGVDRWFNKGAKNSVFETKKEALDNLIFRRKRFQEKLEYKVKYNSLVIKSLEAGIEKYPMYDLNWQ